jgi:spermidine/putrescine transport system substrate-binding protein
MRLLNVFSAVALFLSLTSCVIQAQPPYPRPTLVLYNWAGYMPQSILDAFTAETGIHVKYEVYADQEEAMEQLRTGKQVDLVVLDNTYVPIAASEGLLAKLNYANIPNFRNVSPGFRDLAFDPGNTYSITIQWGTTGLIVRTDRLEEPVTSWNDLWDPRYAGKIGIWPYGREMVSVALKSLNYSLNSEDPAELAEAEKKLLSLRQNVFLIDPALPTAESYLIEDEAVMVYGWTYDAREAQAKLAATTYILPEEGTILWFDNLVIPASSNHKAAAEQFIDFLFRPKISALMVNELWTAVPNDAAKSFINPEILENHYVYPPNESLALAEYLSVISPEAEQRYAQIWQRFLDENE